MLSELLRIRIITTWSYSGFRSLVVIVVRDKQSEIWRWHV